MNRIYTMKAGRELDALVAEKVMGRTPENFPPHYSTEIAAAWEVVEALKQRGIWLQIQPDLSMTDRGVYNWRVCEVRAVWGGSVEHVHYMSAVFEHPAHAICLEALVAIGRAEVRQGEAE